MIVKDTAKNQEAEDIISAILEGADSFILTHETSIGAFPAEATIQLAKAIAEGENIIDYEQIFNEIRQDQIKNAKKSNSIDLLASTACNLALENNVDLFVCLTETGKISRYLSKFKPFQPILSCSTSSFVVKQSNMSRGVIGYKIPLVLSKVPLSNILEKQSDKLLSLILKVAKEQGICLGGNKVLIFQSENEGKRNENLTFKLVDIDRE